MTMIRVWALIVLVVSLTISGSYRARARELSGTIERRREGGLVLAARAAGGLGAFASIVLHAVLPAWMAWGTFAGPSWVAELGVALGLLVVPGVLWVFSSIGRNVSETVLTKTRHDLVQHGPYRWIRHPLYSVGVALILAEGLMLMSWVVLLFALAASTVFRFIVVPIEEKQLEAKFGESYRHYKDRTGAMLPRIL